MTETQAIIVGGALVVALLIAEHYFPWPRRLRRPEAYSAGVLAVLAGFLVSILGAVEPVAAMALFVRLCGYFVIGGLTVFALYDFDWRRRQDDKAAARKIEIRMLRQREVNDGDTDQ